MNIQVLKNGYRESRDQARKVRDILHKKHSWNIWLDMLWCLIRYGARPSDYTVFEYYLRNHRGRDRYMTIFRYYKALKNIDEDVLLKIGTNKYNEHEAYKDFIKHEWMFVDDGTAEKEIRDFIAKFPSVIVKPNKGEQGFGVFKLEYPYTENMDRILDRSKGEEYIIEEYLENIPELKKINPSSLNTIRAYSIIDKDGNCHIIEISLRTGRKDSVVDNGGSGGIGFFFDLDTGICDRNGIDKEGKKYIIHPDSEIQMIGYKLPFWDELLEYVDRISKVEPRARFVGWDIAITTKGLDFIEMNLPGGHDFLQAFDFPVWDTVKKYLFD